jgi:SAM-dependent methyltransferase
LSVAIEMADAREYFDNIAGEYHARSTRGLWRWLREREKRALIQMLDPQPGERILDAGCGAGFYSELLRDAGVRVVAFDISEEMLRHVRDRLGIETMQGKLEDYPFAHEYDKVLCAGALEFATNPQRAVRNLLRALRAGPTSFAVLLLPGAGLMARLYRFFHARHGVHIHLFSRTEIKSLLPADDFKIVDRKRCGFNRVLKITRRETS